MAAGLYDLTTLAAVKAWLAIPDAQTANDALLQSLLSAASRFLINYLSRGNLLSATYTDRFDGSGWGQRSLLLPRWPVTSVTSLSIGLTAIAAAVPMAPGGQPPNGYLLEAWDGIPAGKMQAISLYNASFPSGLQNIAVTYVAGYLATDAGVIPSTPFQITAQQAYGAFAADGGVVRVSNGQAFTKVGSGPTAGQYSVSATGVYLFAAADVGAAVLISYSYIPLDVAQACSQMVGEQYSYRSRIGMISKTLGGQETITFSQKNLTPDIMLMLSNYKNVVPFC